MNDARFCYFFSLTEIPAFHRKNWVDALSVSNFIISTKSKLSYHGT
jgi:hypothetical protein